jgi:tetratricopeptide (TPR) repeat protein
MPPALNTLASVYEAQGRYDVAASYTHQAVVFCTTAVGDEHHVTATLKANLGWLLFRLGKLDSAERYLKEARTVYDDERIDGDLRRAALESACGRVLLARGRLREAGAALRRAAAIYAVVEPDGLAALEASTALAKCQLANDDCEAAQATLRAALAAVPPAAFEPTSVRRDALEFLARAYELAGEFAFAGELRAHAAGSAEASRP